jgi:hypothetical protein
VYEPAPGHSVMISSFASVLVAKAKATPEKVVPLDGQQEGPNRVVVVLTKSIPTISWALLLPAPSTSTAFLLAYCAAAMLCPPAGAGAPY